MLAIRSQRTGAPWRDLPERYGPRTTVYNRYTRWGERGVWQGIFDALAKQCEDSLIFIDSSIVKARSGRVKKGGLAEGIGRSRAGRTSKVHAAVDAKGRPLRLDITGGQVHDAKPWALSWTPLAIVADKAYGTAKIRQQIADEGALAVIPSKSNARHPIPHDPNLYAQRTIVERFFCKMKDMRRLATRFEKSAKNFLAMIQLFAIRCWIN